MMKKIVAAAALALVASSSFAGTPGTMYVGGDIGETKFDGVNDRENSYGAFVGYNFHQNFAIEGGYRSLASDDNADVEQVAVSVVGTLPLSAGFGVFGRLGFNHLSADNAESEDKAVYGVGVSYNFSNKISGRVEYQKPHSDVSNISVGVAYQF
jgi:opacity protein-like surface antigen